MGKSAQLDSNLNPTFFMHNIWMVEKSAYKIEKIYRIKVMAS